MLGTVGRSSALILINRPALVISPQLPRAVAMILDTMTSWLARAPTGGIGWAEAVRASRPAEESNTQQGSSATSSGAVAAVVATPLAASKIVRRGVPCC